MTETSESADRIPAAFSNPVTYRGITYEGDQEIGSLAGHQISGKNRRTIINWCRKGYLPSTKVGGPKGRYFFTIADLINVLTAPGAK